MGNVGDKLRKAGVATGPEEKRCENCGKKFVPSNPRYRKCSDCFSKEQQACVFPSDYPDYFDSTGTLKCEYVTERAEQIAGCLGRASPQLTMHQLRAFYGHVRRLRGALKGGRQFSGIYPDLCKLKPFARERKEKDKIPEYFEQFIARNVDKVKNEDAFVKGFVEHFQAVVAYCAGTIKER